MKKITLQLTFAMLTTFVAFSQGSQNFETQTALVTTYEDGSFTENGITYTYVHSRDEGLGTNDDYSITGKGLMLRRPTEPSSLAWTIPNGIGTLTFDARKAFTGGNNNRQLEVLVNGTSVWTSPMFGTAGADETVHNFSITIDQGGSTTIKIQLVGPNQNRQVTIDNISWTGFSSSSCSAVASLGTSNVSETSVDVSWTAGGTETAWNVEYGIAGFTQGNGTIISVSSANASITGLTANTSYDVYVQANCGNGNLSDWKMINFTTDDDFTNVDVFDLFGFSYHPNPVNDVLHFSSNQPIEKVVVSNMLGQEVKANISSDKTSLDISNLLAGNYFVKITIEGVSQTIKIIKN